MARELVLKVASREINLDYTPGSAANDGDVIVVGDVPYVATVEAEANEDVALSPRGGVYDGAADAAIAGGKDVYWDDSGNQFTETAASNTHFGQTLPGGSYGSHRVEVFHNPKGITGS